MADFGRLPIQGRPERIHLYAWVRKEEEYVHEKFKEERGNHDRGLNDHDLDVFWSRQIIQYIDRARVALEGAQNSTDKEEVRQFELRAQQAICKAMMTAKGCVESMIRVYGPLPSPGVPSGEIKTWHGLD